MTWHTFANSESYDSAASTDLDPVAELQLNRSNGHWFPQENLSLFGASLLGTDLQTVRLNSATLRRVNLPYLRPIQPTLVAANDANFCDMLTHPIMLRANEELEVDVVHDAGAAQRITCVFFAGNGFSNPPAGLLTTMRGTGTTTLTANAWTQATITWDTLLPVGTYSIVGVQGITANGQAVRIVLDNAYWYPGAPALVDENNRLPPMFQQKRLGEWGRFVTTSMPRFQFLANGASTTQIVYMDVIQISDTIMSLGRN